MTTHDIEEPLRMGSCCGTATEPVQDIRLLGLNDDRNLRQLVELYRQGCVIDQDIRSDNDTGNPIAQGTVLPPASSFAAGIIYWHLTSHYQNRQTFYSRDHPRCTNTLQLSWSGNITLPVSIRSD